MLQNQEEQLEQEDNEPEQQHFTFINLLYYTIKLLLPSNAQIQRSFSQINIKMDQIDLKISQLVNWLTFISSYKNGQILKFNLNTKNIFKPQIANFFIKTYVLNDLNKYYQQQQLQKIQNLISGRIFRNQRNKGLIRLLKSKYCSRYLFRFLNISDILKFGILCFELKYIFSQNEYWYDLYNDIYGFTGFTLDQFNWKQKYLLKQKQNLQ